MNMTANDLSEKSKSYYAEADVYDVFSRNEDAPNLIYRKLLPLVANRRLLDLGCGSGKYVELFNGQAREIIGVDASAPQLARARRRMGDTSVVRLIRADAAETGLPDACVDVVLCSWVLGTILDEERRTLVLREAERVLAPRGTVILVENDEGGEFEAIRGRVADPAERTRKYNAWLEQAGFRALDRFVTWFGFASKDEAREIMGAIWGPEAAAKVRHGRIEHRILLLTKEK